MTTPTANTKRLYISNLDTTVDEYAVVKLFEPYGKITFLDYMFHWSGPKKGKPRGYCFLEYEKKEEALKAISALHGRIVKGRPLVVSFAHMTPAQESANTRRGQTSTNSLHRPNTFTILRTQKMASASTDAKINAIERKLAMLQQGKTTPLPRLSHQPKSIRSSLSTEATTKLNPKPNPKQSSKLNPKLNPKTAPTKPRYKPY
ncbi:hypothetical protein BDF14DRAFT_1863753 [Spinellus fusiger]|nr:hypothetical protein BDF14DRAFT_1863753 [Spinellus fusiger]